MAAKSEILITDSLFVGAAHETRLRDYGLEIVRLDKPKATEEELVKAIRGKVAYILGGVEHVTDKVISAADKLQVIGFTGSGYSEYIPAHATATQRGIAITAAVGGNAIAVAEYTLALILMMARRIPLLTSKGGSNFLIAEGFKYLTIGIVGYGNIGRAVAQRASSLGFRVIASSRSHGSGSDKFAKFVPLDELAAHADILSVHVDKIGGTDVLGDRLIRRIKTGASLINVAFPEAVNEAAAIDRAKKKEIFVAFDKPTTADVSAIPAGYWTQSNSQTGFNTREANEAISDMVVESVINVLKSGKDKYLVNPDYLKHRRK